MVSIIFFIIIKFIYNFISKGSKYDKVFLCYDL